MLAALRDGLAGAFPSPDDAGRIAISTRDCLRSCTRDPIARVEPSGEVFSNPTVEDLLRAVREAIVGDEPT